MWEFIVAGIAVYALIAWVAVWCARRFWRAFKKGLNDEHGRGHPQGARRRQPGVQPTDREDAAGPGDDAQRHRR